jgi:hypothetical protein
MSASKRGGARPNAGRPSVGDVRINVRLDQATVDRLREIGDGNLSAGIRIAAQRVAPAKAGG